MMSESELPRRLSARPTLKERIVHLLKRSPDLTDREITDLVSGRSAPQQPINQACRQMEQAGFLIRRRRDDGRIGNYLADSEYRPRRGRCRVGTAKGGRGNENALQEDEVKTALDSWLKAKHWSTKIAWGHQRGIDIDAVRRRKRWIIEVKGCGSRQPMRVNYFLAVLGEMLQRMDDPAARYSVALPDMAQYRGLWERLPILAKHRIGITALFVDAEGQVREER